MVFYVYFNNLTISLTLAKLLFKLTFINMNYEKYDVSTSSERELFEFISCGNKGNIEKMIQFSPTDYHLLYNLGFGDKKVVKKEDGTYVDEIDDKVDSENGDRDKVLATVAVSVYEYTSTYPDRMIVFSGSDERRTRLYRMAITKNYDDLNKDFNIFGVLEIEGVRQTVPFNSNTKFLAYIVKRKEPLKLEI